jgi:hypothetical protein
MSKLLTAVILATAITSPSFAQSYDPPLGYGNLNIQPSQKEQPPQSSPPHVGFELKDDVGKRQLRSSVSGNRRSGARTP